MPQAFEHFHDNLTLSCVCGACNSFFAQVLELFLTRDNVEALLRVRYGLQTKGGRCKLGKSRLIVKVISRLPPVGPTACYHSAYQSIHTADTW